MYNRKERFYGLDCLKFISAIVILLHHYYINTGIECLHLFERGGYLVELFYMISGFLAVSSIEKIRKKDFSIFLIRKVSRFYPVAIMTVILCAIIEVCIYVISGSWIHAEVNYWNIFTSSMLMYENTFVGNNGGGINQPLWFLSVLLVIEVIFWVSVHVADKYQKSVNYIFIVLILLGIAIVSFDGKMYVETAKRSYEIVNAVKPLWNAYFGRGLMAFFLGCVLFTMFRCIESKKLCLISIATVVVYVLPGIFRGGFMYNTWTMSIVFIVYPAIIALFTNSNLISSVCENRIVRFLTAGSFQVYLWQYVFFDIGKALEISGIVNMKSIYMMILINAIIVIYSMIFYHLWEKRLSSLVENWMLKKRQLFLDV